jgi:DNA mismatch repair protein MutS2
MKEAARQAREKLKQREQKIKQGLEQTKPATPRKIAPDQLKVGDRIWIDKLKDHGRVVNISHDRKKATVEVNNMRVEMQTSALSTPQNTEPQATSQRVTVSRPTMSGSVPSELNLIGMTVDEAIPKLENYLARATMSSLPEVRIIHGIGTGRLKQAVHDTLRKHPEIVDYHLGGEEDPGGAGATLVTLREP